MFDVEPPAACSPCCVTVESRRNSERGLKCSPDNLPELLAATEVVPSRSATNLAYSGNYRIEKVKSDTTRILFKKSERDGFTLVIVGGKNKLSASGKRVILEFAS